MTSLLFIGSMDAYESVRTSLSSDDVVLHHGGLTVSDASECLEKASEDSKILVELSSRVCDTAGRLRSAWPQYAGLAVSMESADIARGLGVDLVISAPEQMRAWLHAEIDHQHELPRAGSVIAVVGIAGGVGSSTIALAIAEIYARSGRPSLLIDADTYYPALGLYTGLPPDESGLVGAIRVARNTGVEMRDILKKARVVPEFTATLRVLTGIPSAADFSLVELEPWKNLLDTAMSDGYTVIVDLAPHLETYPDDVVGGLHRHGASHVALSLAHRVMVVSTPHLIHTARLVDTWPTVLQQATTSDVFVCMNGVTQSMSKRMPDHLEALWELAGIDQTHILPHDPALHGGGIQPGASLLKHLSSGHMGTELSRILGVESPRNASSALRISHAPSLWQRSSSLFKAITLKR